MKIHEQITEETWCKGHCTCVDKNGVGVRLMDDKNESHNPKAVKWSLSGWIQKVYPETYWGISKRIEKHLKAAEKLPHGSFVIWSDADDRTFDEVHDLLKKLDI